MTFLCLLCMAVAMCGKVLSETSKETYWKEGYSSVIMAESLAVIHEQWGDLEIEVVKVWGQQGRKTGIDLKIF